MSTAADLAELGKVLVRMPKALSYTKRPWCKVTDGSGKPLLLAAHNYFLPGTRDKDGLGSPIPGCDGLKTGYTAASGSSIILTASRNGRRVIVVVLASAGYPGSYEKGKEITGVEDAEFLSGVTVFHAGTKRLEDGRLVTSGGRVLDVTAMGETFEEARELAYAACDLIQFEGKQLRSDIGLRAIRGRDAWA